jgi:hypothetical protein
MPTQKFVSLDSVSSCPNPKCDCFALFSLYFNNADETAKILGEWKKEAAQLKMKAVEKRKLTEDEVGKIISAVEAEVAQELGDDEDEDEDEDDQSENEDDEEDGSGNDDEDDDGGEDDDDDALVGAESHPIKERGEASQDPKHNESKHVHFESKISPAIFDEIELLEENEIPVEPLSQPTKLYIGVPATLHRFAFLCLSNLLIIIKVLIIIIKK